MDPLFIKCEDEVSIKEELQDPLSPQYESDVGTCGDELVDVNSVLPDLKDEINPVFVKCEYNVPESEDVKDELQESCDSKREPNIARDPEISPVKCHSSRRMKRHCEDWQRVKDKRARNNGQQYTSVFTKEVIQARKVGEPCNCPKKCWEKISEDAELIFNSFWSLGDYVAQNTYLIQNIELQNKKRSYTKGNPSRRDFTFLYSVKINEVTISICKKMFLALHGLQNSRKRIQLIQEQIKEGNVVAKYDGRGKHNNRPNAFSEEDLGSARNFIISIPKYVSHYSQSQNPNRQYLDSNLTINSLYETKYVPWCETNKVGKISSDTFRRLFTEEFCIGFKIPCDTDTCSFCDSAIIQIGNAETTGQAAHVKELETAHSVHLGEAHAAQEKLRYLTGLAQKDPEKYHVITVDLQQPLPTPKLDVGPAFYKRKLWSYNCGVHNCGTDIGYMFLWNESIAKRGSFEVASCLLKYLTQNNVQSQELHVFSKGQNKNWTLISLYFALVQSGKFKQIYHHFPVVGHIQLPCDRDFGRIELYSRKYCSAVYTTEDWSNVILNANTKRKFKVTKMQQFDFKDFSAMTDSISKKTLSDSKQPLQFSSASVFKIDTAVPDILQVGYTYHHELSLYAQCTLENQGLPRSKISIYDLQPKYSSQVAIDSRKYADLLSLLEWIPPAHHEFYMGLVTRGTTGEEHQPENVDGLDDD